MQEATSNKIRDSFGDIKLSMQEIQEAAQQIVFADQAEALNKFLRSSRDRRQFSCYSAKFVPDDGQVELEGIARHEA